MAQNIAADAWIVRLKAAYDAGYYKTEAAVDEQIPLPWSTQRSKPCRSWLAGSPIPTFDDLTLQNSAQGSNAVAPASIDTAMVSSPVVPAIERDRPKGIIRRSWRRLLGR